MQRAETGSRTTRAAVVLRPGEDRCEVWSANRTALVEYAAPFRPRVKSLTPGHLVAVTTKPDAAAFIIWRWFDAVVLEQSAEQVRLWEPVHGEVLAQPRHSQKRYPLGTRAYLSSGLPGAEWWVEGTVGSLEEADVQLDPYVISTWSTTCGAASREDKEGEWRISSRTAILVRLRDRLDSRGFGALVPDVAREAGLALDDGSDHTADPSQ